MNYQDGYSQKALDALAKGKYKSFRSSGLANYRYTEGKKKREQIAGAKQNKTQNPTSSAMANDPRFSLPSVSLPVPTLPMVSAMQNDPRYQAYDGDQVLNQLLGSVQSPVKESPSLPDMLPKAPKESGGKRSKARPSTRYTNETVKNVETPAKPKFDSDLEKEFDEFFNYRYDQADVVDYDPITQTDTEHWRNLKKDIMQKHGWSEKDFKKNYGEYEKYRHDTMKADYVKNSADFAEKVPVLPSIFSLANNIGSSLEGASTAIRGVIGNKNLDKIRNLFPDAAGYYEGGANDNIDTKAKEALRQGEREKIGSKAGQTAYDMAMGLGDMGVNTALGGGTPLGMGIASGLQNAAQNETHALERGIDEDWAARYGLATGAVAGLMNTVGLDSVLKTTGSSVIKNILSSAGKEGLENVAEDIADRFIDGIMNGENSEQKQLVNYYLESGLSQEEAYQKAANDFFIQELTSFGSGALFGGLMSGAKSIPQIPRVTNSLGDTLTKNANQLTDDLTIARRQAANGTNGVMHFDELVGNDARDVLDKRGKLTSVLEKNPQIERSYNGEQKTVDAINSEIETLRRQMDNYAHGAMKENELFDCGATPGILMRHGIIGDKVMMSQDVYDKITLPKGYKKGKGEINKKGKKINFHGLDVDGVEKIVVGLNDPALIMSSDDGKSVLAVVNYTSKNGSPVLVPIFIGKDGTIEDIGEIERSARITSAHIRGNLDSYIEKRASQVRYIKGDGETLGNGLWSAAPESSSPYDSTVNPNGENVNTTMSDNGVVTNDTGIESNPTITESAPIEADPENVATESNQVPTVEQTNAETPVETNQVPSVVNPGITNVPPTDVGNTEGGNGRHTKTSETYINTGRYGGGWTEEEYNQKTDPSQFQYEDVGERESLEKGFGMIRAEGFDEFRDRVMDKERLSGAEIDGLMAEWRIINDNARRLEAEGKDASDVWSEGIKVFRKIQEQSTSNAQALQALAKWSRNTPEGLLTEAENIINGKKKMNEPDKSDIQQQFEKFAKRNKKFKFSDDFVSDFLNKAQELEGLDNESREAKEIMAELGKMINRQLPAKFTEKLTSYLMDSMLGNFRTLITRNAGGNIGLNAVEQFAQRPLAALIDMGVAEKTGRRTQAGLSGKGLAEYVSGFAKGLKEEATDFKKDIHTARSGENTLANAVSQNRHVFKEKGVMDRLDKLVKHGLSVGDRPFYEAVYKQTLGDYQRLRDSGKMGDTIQSLSDEDFDMYSKIAAKTNALSAVYQQDSKLSNALLKFKNAVGDLSEGIVGVDILSQFSMPFVKTPANVIERSIDYSPLGLVRNAIRTGKELKSESGLDQNRFANETARNILGTGLMAGSAALAAKGGMSGGYSEDRDEKQAQKESGMQEYALNLGDGKQMDIGWIPVVGGNAVAAAAAVDAYKNGEGNVLGNLARGAEAGGQALFDQSMFQGLQRLFGTGESYDSDSSIFGNMANVVKSGVGQAVPSIIRQINQVADPYQRDVGNSNEGVSFGMFDNYDLNSLANNVPFLRQMGLAPKVNTSGELVRENQGRNIGSKILEDMILPGRVSKVDVSPLNQEAERLQEATTSSDAYMPKASRKYVDTAEHTLTNQEWTDYQQNYYGSMTEVGNKLMESDAYKSADPDEQVQMLKAGYDAIRYALQSEYSGKEVNGAAKAYEEAGGGEAGINAVIDSVTASHNPYGLDSNEYKDALEKGEDLSSLEGYKETLAENGMTNSKANQQAYKEGGAQALKTKGDIEAYFHDNYGLDAPGVSSAWQNTKREFPMITEDQFNRQYRDIAGQEGDLLSISMNEIVNYINSHPNEYKINGEYNMPKVNQLWRAYKGDNWKQVPYVKKDGSLGHHKQ